MTNRGLFLQPFCYARKPLLSLQLALWLSLPLSLRVTLRAPAVQEKASNGGRRGNPFLHTPCHCEGPRPRGNPFSFKGITDSFVLRTQNDTPFIYCEYLRRADILSFTCHCERAKRARQSASPAAIRSLRPYITAFLYLINKTGVQKVYLLNSLFFTLFYHPKACFAILFCNFPF